jgi:lipoprotein signal peptidase
MNWLGKEPLFPGKIRVSLHSSKEIPGKKQGKQKIERMGLPKITLTEERGVAFTWGAGLSPWCKLSHGKNLVVFAMLYSCFLFLVWIFHSSQIY